MLTIKVDKHCVKEIAATGGIMELSAELLMAVGRSITRSSRAIPLRRTPFGTWWSTGSRIRTLRCSPFMEVTE